MKNIYLTSVIAGIFIFFNLSTCLSQVLSEDLVLIPELSGAGYLEKTPDGNLITIVSNNEIAKINLQGDVLWTRTIAAENYPYLASMLVDEDGSSYYCFNLRQGAYSNMISCPGILHLSPDGDSLWYKSPIVNDSTCSPYYWGTNSGMTQTSDGSIYTTGSLRDTCDNQYFMVSKFSDEGELLEIYTDSLEENFGGSGLDIIEIDGNIYTGGVTFYNTGVFRLSSFLAKFDSELNPVYLKNYHEDTIHNQQYIHSLMAYDGGILFHNHVNQEMGNDYTEFRHVNYDGSEIYRQSLGNNFTDWGMDGLYGLDLTPLSNGGFLYTGWTNHYPSYNCYGIVACYDANGNMQWMNAIGDTSYTCNYFTTDAVELNDGNIAIIGVYDNENMERQSFLLITDCGGSGDFPGFSVLGNEEIALNKFEVYPNPANSSIYISTENHENCNFSILSCDGRVLKTGTIHENGKIDISDLSSGIVFLMMDGYQTQKLVIQ